MKAPSLNPNNLLLGIYSVLAALLTLSAAAHRLQLNTPSYTTSLLIPIEFLLLILLLCSCALLLPYALVAIWRQQWARLGTAAAAFCIALAGIFIAFLLDSATLIYMT